METDSSEHIRTTVQNCLNLLGVQGQFTAVEVLQGGISGALTAQVVGQNQTVILKFTSASAQPFIVARARREINFYRGLAQQVGIPTPTMLGSLMDPDQGSILVLKAYEPARPPADWPLASVKQAAAQLAGLHAQFWGQTAPLNHYPWIRISTGLAVTQIGIQNAQKAWEHLAQQPHLAQVLSSKTQQAIQRFLSLLPKIQTALQGLPPTLLHGDCHTWNILWHSSGELIWADWQEVALGHGVEDVSLFIQRARADSHTFPAAEFISTYHHHLQLNLQRRIPLERLQSGINAFELHTRLLQWPYYLENSPAEQVADMVDRIQALASQTLLREN